MVCVLVAVSQGTRPNDMRSDEQRVSTCGIAPTRVLLLLRPCFDLRQGRPALEWLLFWRCGQQSLSDRLLARKLAGSSNSFRFLARLSLRRLFVRATLLHFSENALALHLFLEN